MPAVAVAILAENASQIPVLQGRVDSTALARTVYTHASFPSSSADPIIRQIQDLRAEVVLLDFGPEEAERAAAAIELLRSAVADLAVFAISDLGQPLAIVAAMRAGACEFLDRSSSSSALLEAFARYTSQRHKARHSSGRALVTTFINGKAGSGATTLAVNSAMALQREHGSTVLVDFAALGHAALHLNVRPNFGLLDALQNLHRLDSSLLESLMTPAAHGLHLLAGAQVPVEIVPTPAELAHLFDLLVSCYRYVVVDASSRLDPTARLLSELSQHTLIVAQADVVALWSVGRVQAFLSDGVPNEKIRLVLNRYKKIPGFADEDAEKATNCKIFWKIPNQFQAIAPAIDRGEPFVLQESLEASRSLKGMVQALGQAPGSDAGTGKPRGKEKASRPYMTAPIRAGQ
jgi:pilus assembly protein CpaE